MCTQIYIYIYVYIYIHIIYVCVCLCKEWRWQGAPSKDISGLFESLSQKRSNPRTVSFNGEHDDPPWDFVPHGVMPLKEDMSFAKAAAELGANVPSCHVAEAFSAARENSGLKNPQFGMIPIDPWCDYIIYLGYFVIEIEPIYSCKIVEDRLIKFWC